MAQYGKCYVLGIVIKPKRICCHRKVPLDLGGNDEYKNIIIVDIDVHNLIIETNKKAIKHLLQTINLDEKQLRKVNKLREMGRLSKNNL